MTTPTSVQEYVAHQASYTRPRKVLRTIIRTLGFRALWRVEVTGMENIPPDGPSLIMMNHISLIDPVLCMGAVTHRFVVPMTKIENLRNPLIGPFIRWWGAYSVNRGEVDRRALVNSIELIKSGQLILIAPEGTRHPEGLAEPKDGLAYVALKADAVVIPTGISGAVEWLQSMKRLRRPSINVNFGRPFRFRKSGNRRHDRDALAVMSREAMYQLALAIKDESRRGVYSDLNQVTTDYLEFV